MPAGILKNRQPVQPRTRALPAPQISSDDDQEMLDDDEDSEEDEWEAERTAGPSRAAYSQHSEDDDGGGDDEGGEDGVAAFESDPGEELIESDDEDNPAVRPRIRFPPTDRAHTDQISLPFTAGCHRQT